MVESDFPVGVDSPVRYGKNIETLIGYLSVRQYLPFKRLQEMLNDIFAVQISEGGLHWLLNRLAAKGVDAYEMIRQNVLHSRVIGTDETGVKINGKKHWFWTWQNNRATYIVTSPNRGTTTIDENMSGISGEAVLVHDCWKAHFQTPVKKHQLCTAHLERETKYLEERYKVTWPVRFRVMLREAQKLKKQFAPSDYYYPNQLLSHLEKELEELLSEPLDPKHKEMIAFQKRITKYRDHVFTFLYHPDVPPDNNGSERAIRNVKVKQKISGQFKILSAAENFAILRSIIDTAIKNNRNVVEALNVIANYKIN
jgi:transposase-like protein